MMIDESRPTQVPVHTAEVEADPPGPVADATTPLTPEAPRPRRRWFRVRRARQLLIPLDFLVLSTIWILAPLAFGTKRSLAWTVEAGFLAAGVTVGVWWFNGMHSQLVGRERTQSALRLGHALLTAAVVTIAVNGYHQKGLVPLAVTVAVLSTVMVLTRSFVGAALRVARTRGFRRNKVMVIGLNDEARDLLDLIRLNPDLGLDVVALLGNPAQAASNQLELAGRYSGPIQAAPNVVRDQQVTTCVVVTSALSHREREMVVAKLWDCDVDLHITAGYSTVDVRRLNPQPIAYTAMFSLPAADRSSRRHRLRVVVKRAFDVSLASLLLILSSPLLAIGMIAVRLTGGGSVLYRQTRLGRGGAEIELLRLRTMTTEPSNPELAAADTRSARHDPRMTLVGRVLEKTCINEIPQLWNVVRGDLSFVGPCPGYSVFDLDKRPLPMRPGFTGLWRTEANLFPSHVFRRQLDDLYLENWSLTLDLAIVISSIELVFTRILRGSGWRHSLRPEDQALVADTSAS